MAKWSKGNIEGVIIINLSIYSDHRGMLCETFRSDGLPPGLTPVMSYISYTEPGMARGPHEHSEQTDIFAIPGPGIMLLKLWDNRLYSATYLNYMEIYAGKDKPLAVIIPPGIVHGYLNTSKTDRALVINYPDRLYKGAGKKEPIDEIRYENDPESPFQMES